MLRRFPTSHVFPSNERCFLVVCWALLHCLGGNLANVDDFPGTDQVLTAASAQRLAAAVDGAATAATSSEQLAGTARSLASDAGNHTLLSEALVSMSAINNALLRSLQDLRDQLVVLFTEGRSAGLLGVLDTMTHFPGEHTVSLGNAASAMTWWTKSCQAPDVAARYAQFEALRDKHKALDAELRRLGAEIFVLREARATADGKLDGLEERLGRQRPPRSGEEYEAARYVGSSLFKWQLLRTKVAHHLAVAFTSAREEGLQHSAPDLVVDAAEKRLSDLEDRLGILVGEHKQLAEQRSDLVGQLRTLLKSMVLGCEEESVLQEPSASALVSKRFKILRGRKLGVKVQAAEELSRFLNITLAHYLPQTVSLLTEVLAPYNTAEGIFVLPTTWKARPQIGRWWEWLDEQRSEQSTDKVLNREEFENRFLAAKRRFSVHVSAGEPVVMAYLLWLLLEDSLGIGNRGHEQVLALPSPADAIQS